MSTDVTTWTCCDWFSSCSVFSVMKSEHVGVERVLMEVYFCQEQKFIVESRSGLKVMKSELWERKSEESNLHPDVAQMSSVGDLKPVFCLTQQSCLFLSGGITIKTKSTRPHKTRLFLCWSQTSLRTNSLISSWYRLCWYKIIILSCDLSYYCNKYLIWSNWLNTPSWTLSSRTQNWTSIT